MKEIQKQQPGMSKTPINNGKKTTKVPQLVNIKHRINLNHLNREKSTHPFWVNWPNSTQLGCFRK